MSITFDVMLKLIQQKGNLAWEYNPFRNYRLDLDMIYYKDRLWTYLEFLKEFVPTLAVNSLDEPATIKNFPNSEEDAKSYLSNYFSTTGNDWYSLGLSKAYTTPIVYLKGLLVDFITDEFNYDLNHPVSLLPSYSYDNSVDIIINDGNQFPKLINSRFSAVGRNKYEIINRTGDNDTNIYDKGTLFNIDTSLYKVTTHIPEITFAGVSYGGNLKIGNYFFYFKYADADGNESDFVGSSGLVSVFMGNTPNSIHSGFRNQNSTKKVKFLIENTDQAYLDLIIYYTRATSDFQENATIETYKILQKFKILENKINPIIITGFEEQVLISDNEVNLQLQVYSSAQTQAFCLNRLFLGNVTQNEENYDELLQCALNIYPQLNTDIKCDIDKISSTYKGDISNTYYNPHFIYNNVGYWDDEIYRFGVVFIKNNNTLSFVYNVRGLDLSQSLKNNLNFNDWDIRRNKVEFDSYTYQITSETFTESVLENSKGVTYIHGQRNINDVIGITFIIPDPIKEYLQSLGIKGLFFVRQKRIPTTLCLAYTIGVENNVAHLPVLEVDSNYIYESFLTQNAEKYTYYEDAERKSATGHALTHDFNEHKRNLESLYVSPWGAICPDYDVNYPYLNSLFTGSEFTIQDLGKMITEETNTSRLYEVKLSSTTYSGNYPVRIVGVEDNVKLVGIESSLMSARAGEAEEASKFVWMGKEDKSSGRYPQTNPLIEGDKKNSGGNKIVRGSYGPYLGITGFDYTSHLINIKIPGYDVSLLNDYFLIRANDKSPFYAISDRLVWDSSQFKKETDQTSITCYRGDCYISKFTHRLNRNFVDPSAPTNTTIVDYNCWDRGITFEDDVLKTDDLGNLNLGDINAVDLGMWISIIVRSNINHSVRSLNESNVDEKALFGNARGFYPYYPINASSPYKLAEAGGYNKGFERGVSELVSIILPDVPYIKNNFSTRIAYSNIKISNSFLNSYRTFPGMYYRDYPINYGSITKLLELNGNLICVLEHGIFRIPVNERAIAAKGDGGNAYINTSNVLPENPQVISDTFGSLWADSVILTPAAIYGVDTVGKKIWKIDRNDLSFSLMSDFRILEFLNNNITFTERELEPVIGIRNVKTHYNNFKHDVMFTFYDDTNTFEETVWNLCWNEILGMWVTFYSWVPSYSENIYNQYFSFDRDTSKYIAKLGMTADKDWKDGFYLDNVFIEKDSNEVGWFKPRFNEYQATDVTETYEFKLLHDIWQNYKLFEIEKNDKGNVLKYTGNYKDYTFSIEDITEISYNNSTYYWEDDDWKDQNENKVKNLGLETTLNKERLKEWKKRIRSNDIKVNLNNQPDTNKYSRLFPNEWNKRLVYYLNVRMYTTLIYEGQDASYEEFISNNSTSRLLSGGYTDYTIAVIPREHLDALSTDFWKHGLSGIIDITEDILPTKWYGTQHPFEFEFVVNEKPFAHKIFDSLRILSNNAEPESFHYEIIGDSYEFANDKKNMYVRQEATKRLYQYNGFDVTYDHNYSEVPQEQRPLKENGVWIDGLYEKSTLFPLYYSRRDSINTVEDHYHHKDGKENGKDYSALAGAEIIRYKTLDEYRIWNHAKAVDVRDNYIKGNMQYKEDSWHILINPLNIVLKNEPMWSLSGVVPIELGLSPIPDLILENNTLYRPDDREVVTWAWEESSMLEAKIRDKWIKIRVRYSGKKLAIVLAIQTLFSISYS